MRVCLTSMIHQAAELFNISTVELRTLRGFLDAFAFEFLDPVVLRVCPADLGPVRQLVG